MKTKKLHSWDLSFAQARDLQKRLSEKVQLIELKDQPKTVAGLDCALSSDKQRVIACAVVLKLPETIAIPAQAGTCFELIETATAWRKVSFPYIPGLLSFREAPACIAAVEELKSEPDMFIIDGQGIAHPRRLGLAAHLGLFFDKPTIGCAKSRLTGYFEDPPLEKGSWSLLESRKRTTSREPQVTDHGIIGAVVRTRTNVKPVFVSVGNKCLLKDAIKIILACATQYRLPEPTRLAHQLVSRLSSCRRQTGVSQNHPTLF